MSETNAYAGLNPSDLWQHFRALNNIPRPSGGEQGVRNYIQRIANSVQVPWEVDARGNLVIYVPPTSLALAEVPPIAIQTHMDMVCEKTPESTHNFEKDAIRPRRKGDYIFATDTTLGADNGIGVAAALSLLTQRHLHHGPIELIFTVEEETGLYGAAALDVSLIKARRLINLDSESVDSLTVGSAAGANAVITFPVSTEMALDKWIGKKLTITGLRGGHSGLQIHERLANGIKLLVELLASAHTKGLEYQLESFSGGNADNSIPRLAECRLTVAPGAESLWKKLIEQASYLLGKNWSSDEPGLDIEFLDIQPPKSLLTEATRDALLQLLAELPHGIAKMSDEFPNEVETSSNLAQVEMRDKSIRIITSCRSFVAEEMDEILDRVVKIAKSTGATVEIEGSYPGWQPKKNSGLLKITKAVFEKLRGDKPNIRVTHGGLECGFIVSKIKGMDAISFGPSIDFAHTPQEQVSISSVDATWKLLVALLEVLSQPAYKPVRRDEALKA
jgi:dipeptidase D